MKALLTSLSAFFFIGMVACKKEENKVIYEGGKTPQLTGSTNAVRLEAGEEANLAIRFNWTNPEYKFTTGPSSQNVSYKLEIDIADSNFTRSKRYIATISSDLSKSFTVGELNGILGNTMELQLDPRRSYTMAARVTASINEAVKLVSNVVTFTARPFPPPPKVDVPFNDEIWLVGGASAGNWNLPKDMSPAVAANQKFIRRSRTQYDLTIDLNASNGYLILPAFGSWDNKYCLADGLSDSERAALSGGGDFLYKQGGGSDFMSPTPGGTFKISLDFQLGKFTVVRQ